MWLCALWMALASLISGNAPKQNGQPERAQQATAAQKPPPLTNQPASASSEQPGCPGTPTPELSCEAITANATLQQADLMRGNNWLGLVTAAVAGLAAWFAASAARAATKSYKAFVAAEDAYLSVEFPNGTIVESSVDGVSQPDTYFLTAIITNLGRTTARVHGCSYGEEHIPIQKTLKTDESEELGWRIQVDSLAQFDLHISYSTPMRPKAELILTVSPMKFTGRKTHVEGRVVKSRFADERRDGWWPW
jgi:hypothetical protein